MSAPKGPMQLIMATSSAKATAIERVCDMAAEVEVCVQGGEKLWGGLVWRLQLWPNLPPHFFLASFASLPRP